MRDIRRIKKILCLLELVWNQEPDLRFGQMLINHGIVPNGDQVWNYEDETLEEYLELLVKK